MTVVPAAMVSPLLGCGPAVWECVPVVGLALDGAVAGEEAGDDVAGWLVLADDAAELAGAEVGAWVEAAVVLDDDPHAASSSSEPNPAAAVHPLLRIEVSFRAVRICGSQPPVRALAGSVTTCHTPSMPLPLVDSAFADFRRYSGSPL
jgi:hypothetical protein